MTILPKTPSGVHPGRGEDRGSGVGANPRDNAQNSNSQFDQVRMTTSFFNQQSVWDPISNIAFCLIGKISTKGQEERSQLCKDAEFHDGRRHGRLVLTISKFAAFTISWWISEASTSFF